MAEYIEFYKQFQRQFADSLDNSSSFETYDAMNAYLSNNARYSGQIATCKDREGIIYILNETKDEWLANGVSDYWTIQSGEDSSNITKFKKLQIDTTNILAIVSEDEVTGVTTLYLEAGYHNRQHEMTSALDHSPGTNTNPYYSIATKINTSGTVLGLEWKLQEVETSAQIMQRRVINYPTRFTAGQKFVYDGTLYILNSDKSKWIPSDFQKLIIGDFKEASETSTEIVTVAHADSYAFYAAHGTCQIGDKFYIGERQYPTSLTVFNDPKDLTNYTKVVIPFTEFSPTGIGLDNLIDSMCYDDVNNIIYATMYYNASYTVTNGSVQALKIISINPDDISDYNVAYSDPFTMVGVSPTISTDGEHYYIGTYLDANCKIIKINIASSTEVSRVTIPNIGFIHASMLQKYSDRNELYVTARKKVGTAYPSDDTKFIKLNCADLSYSVLDIPELKTPSDDFEFIYTNDLGGKAYLISEGSLLLSVVNTETMTYINYPSVTGFFCKRVGDYIYAGKTSIARHNIADPSIVTIKTTPNNERANELFVSSEGETYYTCWRNSYGGEDTQFRSLVHFRFCENTGGFTVRNNEAMFFKGEDGITIDYNTAKTVTIRGSGAPKLQKFTAITDQATYTITSFIPHEDCLVYVNNVLQDVTVSGQDITLGFGPDGGEIIKVLNVTT